MPIHMPLPTPGGEIGGTMSASDAVSCPILGARAPPARTKALAVSETDATRESGPAADAIARSNVFKSRFLASVSHDLRQPLQTLRMLTAALRQPLGEDERNVALHQVDHALGVMSDLVNAVLNVSRLDSGIVQPVIRNIVLADLFEDIRIQLAAVAECKGLKIEVRASELQVRTDQVLLREILQNLVANAIRYTDAGQVTVCAVLHHPGLAAITVEDTGIGIPPASLQAIFEDFVQVPRPTGATRGGVGLGLGTVRRIAELLRLSVRVDSMEGVGSRFTVLVPTADEHEVATPPVPGRSATEIRPKSHTVVFVDDNDAVRNATVLYLEKIEGYRVNAASSISDLETMLGRLDTQPAIIISDYQLGNNMFGTDAVRLVRAKFGAAVPAIMMTGDTSAIAEEVIEMSATALLNKPVDVGVLTLLMADMITVANQ